jgi:hypothetical protein
VTPVPLGSSWGDRDRSPADGVHLLDGDEPAGPAAYLRDGDRLGRPGESGISAAWIAGLVAACTGGALALIGLTLPWASITPSGGAGYGYLAQLADLHPVAAPVAAFALILAGAGAAVGFASGSRQATLARWFTVLLSSAAAVVALFLTVYRVAGSAVVARDPSIYSPLPVVAGDVAPSVGCVLYALGLLLLATGTGVGYRLPRGAGAVARPAAADEVVRAVRVGAHRAAVVLAVAAAVASAVLPWDRVEPEPGGSSALNPFGPGRADVRVWLATYRIGLVLCLALIVAAVVLPGSARRLRGAGQVIAVAVTTALVSGYALLWWPLSAVPARPGTGFATLRLGAGYPAGLLATAFLAAAFFLLPAGRPPPGPPPDPAADPADD